MSLGTRAKDPDATVDYAIDWSAWLGSDTLLSSTWVVPSGLTQPVSPAASFTSTVTTVWLTGGTLGQSYTVTNRITTAAGRIDDRSFDLRVEER